MKYQPRFYRNWVQNTRLSAYTVNYFESDLMVYAKKDISQIALVILKKYREIIETHIKSYPEFLTSMNPLSVSKGVFEPIIERMISESSLAGVGPMASVAGAISEYVGNDLLAYTDEIIIENGGDIFIKSDQECNLGLYAGADSAINNKLGIKIDPQGKPKGICTSSGKIGHSVSFGKADTVVIISSSTIFADAMATRVANMIKSEKDISKGLDFSREYKMVEGIFISVNDKIGCLGALELTKR